MSRIRVKSRTTVAVLAASLVGGALLIACAAEERHRVLTLLFDGVPPMEGSAEPASKDVEPDRLSPLEDAEAEAFLAAADEKAASLTLNHATFAADCSACHGDGRAVSDDRCTVCHTPRVHQKTVEATMTCGACHVEHQGRLADITKVETRWCMECHDEGPFEEYHPEFAMVEDAGKAMAARRETGLWFVHAPHVREGASECTTCHVPNETNDTFHPPRYDANCSECHEVELHKNVAAMDWTKARLALGETDPGVVLQPSRLWAAAEQKMAGEAHVVALREARGAIESGALADCVECHWLADRQKDDAHFAAIADVAPSYDWYEHVAFSHRAHAYQQCTSCHEAPSAADERAGRLMLPSKAKCAECHYDGGAPNACSNCHTYHKRTPDFGADPEMQRRAVETLRVKRAQ